MLECVFIFVRCRWLDVPVRASNLHQLQFGLLGNRREYEHGGLDVDHHKQSSWASARRVDNIRRIVQQHDLPAAQFSGVAGLPNESCHDHDHFRFDFFMWNIVLCVYRVLEPV